jgi:AcrR family transcriptional regulator
MSRNAKPAPEKLDRRIRRTRDRLGDALVALILEKPFDAITVQEVLDRAGVGRSTFYAHYRDKEDLFVSDADEFLELIANMLSRRKEASERVAPVRELFAHVADWKRFHDALAASSKLQDFLDLAQGHFARSIAARLSELPRSREIPAPRRAALAQAFAGGLLSLMSWWLEAGGEETPEQMDALFHRMVWDGVAAPLATGRSAPRTPG